jgi:hypothetical protein
MEKLTTLPPYVEAVLTKNLTLVRVMSLVNPVYILIPLYFNPI